MFEDRDTTNPTTLPAPLTRRWTDRFAIDLAMTAEGSGDPPAMLLKEHGYTTNDLVTFSKDPLFMQRFEKYRTDLRERGLSFKMKAQAQAEEFLTNTYLIVNNDATSPAVKADLIKWMAKMAGYEPTKESMQAEGGVTINIHMGDDPSIKSGIRTVEDE